MSDTPTFTARQVIYVRQMLDSVPIVYLDGVELDLAHVLSAFAQRLEQEATLRELKGPLTPFGEESLREEGRRSVYAEIARLDPTSSRGDRGACNFCGADVYGNIEPHEPNCVWLRAQEATK